MASRHLIFRPCLGHFPLPRLQPTSRIRYLHKNVAPSSIPPPTPFVPNTETLLKLIGRNMSRYASKLNSWNDFFTMSSEDFRNAGIETAKDRKYLLRWREKFRQKEYGVGGDLDHVHEGIAQLRAIEVTSDVGSNNEASHGQRKDRTRAGSLTQSPGKKWIVVNPPFGTTRLLCNPTHWRKYAQIKLHSGNQLKGPYLKLVKGTNGTVAELHVQEGMWEHRLGRKIDGGERRRAEVRAKKRSQESRGT